MNKTIKPKRNLREKKHTEYYQDLFFHKTIISTMTRLAWKHGQKVILAQNKPDMSYHYASFNYIIDKLTDMTLEDMSQENKLIH